MPLADRRLWVHGGIAGVLGTACYILAITLPWPESQLGTSCALVIASAWPILSIIYSYALYSYIAAERESAANRLGLVFAVVGFTTVLAMVVVQFALGAGLGQITASLDGLSQSAFRRALNLVDLGLDVAWDMLIGTALIFSGVAMRRRGGMGPAWGIASALLGVALIVLNVATFPWPPGDRGLIDIGPAIGLFVILLATRLALLGRRSTD